MNDELEIKHQDPALYNEDLAPISFEKRSWGTFEMFNVWANDVQSLFGYTLIASLFVAYGLNGWLVFLAVLVAGFFIMWLVNIMGESSFNYGVPFAVMARTSMGVRGAKFPAVVRSIVAIFWYGAQTYFASTAVSLLLGALLGGRGDPIFLGMSGIDWVSFLIVSTFQIWLFWHGMSWISGFLNFAGPFVYALMIIMAIIIWTKAGGTLLSEMGTIFKGKGDYEGGTLLAFLAVVGTMIAYFAAVVVNYGDFSRFMRTRREMKLGNLIGLPLNMAFFALIALVVTAGTVAIWEETLTNPTDMIGRVDILPLTFIAAILFFVATVGINVVANFVPAVYTLSSLAPSKISFRIGGLIASGFALVIGGLWVSTISQIGIFNFVNTLGAILAPFYGIMIADYYMVKNRRLELSQMFSTLEDGSYYYNNGWNRKAILAFSLPAIFSVATVWMPEFEFLSGFSWVIGAFLGGAMYFFIMKKSARTLAR